MTDAQQHLDPAPICRAPRARLIRLFAVAILLASASVFARADDKPRAFNVLLVNGRPAKENLDRATGYLAAALNPFGDKGAPKGDKVRPRVLPASDFAGLSENDLATYDCIYFCDVPRLIAAEVQRLEAYVRRGGAVVFFLGPQVDLESYNKHFFRGGKSLLPAQLLKVESAPEKKSLRFHIPDGALERPPLKELGDKAAILLAQPAIAKYVQVARPMPEAKVETILSLGTGPEAEPTKVTTAGPAVVAWHPKFGGDKPVAGRVVLVTTTADAEWSSWPSTVSYVIFQHELLRFVAPEKPRR